MPRQPLENKDYDLISVIYHASQVYETCQAYAKDAEQGGDKDAAIFFNEVRVQEEKIIEKGKELLKNRLH